MAASVDNFKTFHLSCFDFMSNAVRIICLILIITLSVKIKTKICLLGQFSSLVYHDWTLHEIRNRHRKHH